MFNCGNIDLIEKAIKVISHRGPENIGIKWFPENNSGLGHARLSIIDLSFQASQPMSDSTGRYYIIYNGEIYNYLDIKQELLSKGFSFNTNSDTEVILNAYLCWGKDSLKKFNGMFSFALFDSESGDLFAARDRIGIKPFYYYYENDKLIIASEIKAIIETGVYKKEVDYNSLFTPVHFQIAPYTGFKNILKLLPGKSLFFSKGALSIETFWEINPNESNSNSFLENSERLDDLLNSAVKHQMVSDVPVGILLSGGLDSSIISALMKRNTEKQINSFTIKFKSKDLIAQGNIDDSYYAKKIASIFNFNHHEIVLEPDVVELLPKIIWHLEEPLADPSAINTYLICKAAREAGIIVLLNGNGGDEIFGGYRSYIANNIANKYKKLIPEFIHLFIKNTLNIIPQASKSRNYKLIRWFKEFINYAYLPEIESYISYANAGLNNQNFNQLYDNPSVDFHHSFYYLFQKEMFEQQKNIHPYNRLCYCDTKVYLPDHNLNYADKASMAASVECRPPLTDHRIVEFMFTLSEDYRIKNFNQKYLLKKVSENYLPKEIIYRPKAPFSAPLRSWLKGPLKEMVNDLLSEKTIKERGFYNYQFAKKVIENNNKGLQDNSQIIWRMITNELWFRTFFS